MKKNFLTFFVLFAFVLGLNAGVKRTVDVRFDEEQFTLLTNPLGVVEIVPNASNATLGSDTSQPGLPLVPVNIRVPLGTNLNSVTESISKKVLLTNVDVAANPVSFPTNAVIETGVQGVPAYVEKTYPAKSVEYVATSTMDGYTVLRFLVCPFIYDAAERNLYFIDKFSLNLDLDGSIATYTNSVVGGENMYDIVSDMTIGVDGVSEQMSIDIKPIFPIEAFIPTQYVIITTEELADAFKPLMLWKKTKGLKACITTVEWIKEKYPADDVQASIKYYLYDMYKNSKLKFALLGGDDTVVPVRKCRCNTSSQGKDLTPTDLYYACFNNDFLWNANGNDVYGEMKDNVGMDPSIFVTRAPVRTAADVKAFVDKVIGYEKTPLEKGWNNNILMAGNYLFTYKENGVTKYDDAERQGDRLYKNYIAPYWNGERKKFYNSGSDFGADYTLNVENFHEQLSKGYTFVEMISHGKPVSWKLDNGLEYFTTDVEKLENKGYTIITTNACETNAFDDYLDWESKQNDPCLSESFIRSTKSGVVAYLGSSRYGWTSAGAALGSSMKYEAAFYEKLLSPSFKDKNFGLVVAAAKQSLVNSCFMYGELRWLQFSINPVGDPEMPIFTAMPKKFGMVGIGQKPGTGDFLINTGVDSCTICVMSIDDEGTAYYDVRRDVASATFTNPKCNLHYEWCEGEDRRSC